MGNIWPSYEGNTDRGRKQNSTKFNFNLSHISRIYLFTIFIIFDECVQYFQYDFPFLDFFNSMSLKLNYISVGHYFSNLELPVLCGTHEWSLLFTIKYCDHYGCNSSFQTQFPLDAPPQKEIFHPHSTFKTNENNTLSHQICLWQPHLYRAVLI